MNVLLLGATGKLGQQILAQALERGHFVTVLARTPGKVTLQHTNLTVVAGDALNANIMSNAMPGKDAVISSLGVGDSFKSNNLIASVAQVLLPAMKLHQVRRLLFVSAFGVGDTYKQANFLQRLFFRFLLKDMYADKVIGDNMIRNSNLDWTIIMPLKLTNGKLTKNYVAAEKMTMKGMPVISRADTASFVLDALEQSSWIRMSPIVMKS